MPDHPPYPEPRYPEPRYPEIAPRESGWLDVDPPHRVWWERSGKAGGVPAVHLHGGPGGAFSPSHRRVLDPDFYDLVLFDQRGGGRSTPAGELTGNDTPALIADIERLRAHLGIESWLVGGGSWGSLLALSYAQAHPARVRGLVLRGVTLGSAAALDWIFRGARAVFPDLWAEFASGVPEAERGDLAAAYGKRIFDPATEDAAAASFWAYTTRLAPYRTPAQPPAASPEAKRNAARIFFHYLAHGLFVAPGALLRGVEGLRHLPCILVHGRHDCVTPPMNAHELSEHWPEAELRFVANAGHDPSEPALMAALTQGFEDMKARLPR